MPCPVLADTYTNRFSPPHSSGMTPVLREVRLHSLGIGIAFVDLVDGHQDWNLGRTSVLDRLDRLWHHPVVRGNNQHDDVGNLRATRAHGREGGMAGRVEKCHGALRRLDVVRTDVLRNSAGFPAATLVRRM